MQGRRQITSTEDIEATIESASSELSADTKVSSQSWAAPLCSNDRLVEGSSSGMLGETQSLLQTRLRTAALVILTGFVLFFFRNVIWFDNSNSSELYDRIRWPHAGVSLALAFVTLLLCTPYKKSLLSLRLMEKLVFGLPGAFFLLLQYLDMPHCAEQGYMQNPALGWLMLIFNYAFFIPNTWKGALVVVGSFAIAPILLTVYLVQTNTACRSVIEAGSPLISTLILSMTMATITAVVGVRNIRGLRSAAYEAKQLGQYRLKERLGGGAMGDVYLGEHQMMKRPCAIKVIRPEKAGDARVLARFEREVQATSQLSHWNSIDIYDYGRTDDGTFYYVMEYLPGCDLKTLVEKIGPLPPERTVHFLKQVCMALREAHEMGLVHRDIKPANVLTTQRGKVHDVAKLVDFGLVKPITNVTSPNMTQHGVITGSPLFMSPEQATGGDDLDARSDLYSLGAVGYFLLTGKPPFPGKNAMAVIIAHASETPRPLSELCPNIPSSLAAVIDRCLSKKPITRYQTASELHDALEQLHELGDVGNWSQTQAAAAWESFAHESPRPSDAR